MLASRALLRCRAGGLTKTGRHLTQVACHATLNMCGLAQVGWQQVLRQGDFVVDATCGNGLDTLFLAQAVGATGSVLAIDVQERAVAATRELLERSLVGAAKPELQYECVCHSQLLEVLGPRKGMAKVVALNLGYLPGAGDKSVATSTSTTQQAVEAALQAVCVGGMVSCMCYMHNDDEYRAVSSAFAALGYDWAATETKLTNKKNAPVLCLAWRLE